MPWERDTVDDVNEHLTRLEPGSVFAGYRIEGVLDRGGMGVVYRATDEDLNRTVALKIIAPEHTQNPDAVTRFKAEARLAASLEHPNIVPIHRGGEYRGVLYLAMRFVPGTNLRQVIDRGQLPLDRTLRIITAVASALDAAHQGGLVHRDVKPANILISGEGDHEQVYLTDFGLTKRLGSAGSLTRTGTWVGTPDYVAPEQIRAGNVDGRADVYSLGCVLYEMLAGEVAYPKDNDMAKLWAHVQDPCPMPSEKRPELDKAFDDIVARATAKEPDDRYPRASDLAAAVSAAVAGQRGHIERAALQATLAALPDAPADEHDVFLAEPTRTGSTPPQEPLVAARPAAQAPSETPPADPGSLVIQPAQLGNAERPAGEPESPPTPNVLAAAAAPPAAAPPAAAGPPAGPPNRPRARDARDPSRNRWILGGAIAAVTAAVVVAGVLLLGGGDGGTATPAVAVPTALAAQNPVPYNRVRGRGTVRILLRGNNAEVTVKGSGLLSGAHHLMHIHAGAAGTCPNKSAAKRHPAGPDGNLAIDTKDGASFYGPVVVSLTRTGPTTTQGSILAFRRYPIADAEGDLSYRRTIALQPQTAAAIRDDNAVVVTHGIDYNDNGTYDSSLGTSELNSAIDAESTAPALCGPLRLQPSGTSKTASLVTAKLTVMAAMPADMAMDAAGMAHMGH
jgi:serine/threonine protein kinase